MLSLCQLSIDIVSVSASMQMLINKNETLKRNINGVNMSIKSFERPLIEISQGLAFQKAKLIDNEYRLDISELSAADKSKLVSHFMLIANNLDNYFQEFLDDACMDRMYAESERFRGWDE